METHPEFPPNCDFFQSDDDLGDYFTAPDWECALPWALRLDHATDRDKKIIACVASEYWTQESMSGKRTEGIFPSKAAYRDQCLNRADEWRKWGGLIK